MAGLLTMSPGGIADDAAPENQAPIIQSTPPSYGSRRDGYQHAMTVRDPERDRLSFSLVQGPAGMTVDHRGRIAWQPSADAPATSTFTVRVSDAHGATAEQTGTIRLVDLEKVGVTHDWVSKVAELDDGYMVGITASRLLLFHRDNVHEILDEYPTAHHLERDIIAYQGIVFVQGRTGVEYFDLRDPRRIVHLGTLPVQPVVPGRMNVWRERLFVGRINENGIACWSLADPAAPKALPDFTDLRIVNMAFHQDHVYTFYFDGMTIVDATDLDAPRVIGPQALARQLVYREVIVRPPYMYVSVADKMRVFDISTPGQPKQVWAAQQSSPFGMRGVGVGHRLWYWEPRSVTAYDLSTPDQPRPDHTLRRLPSTAFMASASQVYQIDAAGRAQPFADDPQALSAGGKRTEYEELLVAGDHLYVATNQSFQVYDISKRRDPRLIAELKNVRCTGMVKRGDLIVSPTTIIDVSAPDAPQVLGRLRGGNAVDLVGQTAYVVTGSAVDLWDITDRQAPEALSRTDFDHMIAAIVCDGHDRVYLGLHDGVLLSCRLESDNSLVVDARLKFPGKTPFRLENMMLDGDRLYVALYSAGSAVIDVSDPKKPRLHSRLDSTNLPTAIIGRDGLAVAAMNHVAILDLRRQGQGEIVASLDGFSEDVALTGAYIYSADRYGGISVYHCPFLEPERASDADSQHTAP